MSLPKLIEKLPSIVLLLMGALITYQLAQLSWSLFTPASKPAPWVAPKPKMSAQNQLNTTQLQQQNLFGKKAVAKQSTKMVGAPDAIPKTRLNLTLVGVVAATDPKRSSAIIASRGSQDSYFVGSSIANTGAKISRIFQDRILLDVNGIEQTLMLDGVENIDRQRDAHESRAPRRQAGADRSGPRQAPNKVTLDRAELSKDPSKLADHIRISPVRVDNQLKGYRVTPAGDRALFNKAGLKPGDLVLELNGVDVTDTQAAFTLLNEFANMTEVNLTVERAGQLHEIFFSIP